MSKEDFDERLKNFTAQYPNMFDDRDHLACFDNYYVIDPRELIEHENFNEWWEHAKQLPAIERPSIEETGSFGGHPGGLDPDQSIATLAFYLPFHLYPEKWGIYVFADGIQVVNKALQGFFTEQMTGVADQYRLSHMLLEQHETFHHNTEIFVTRLETTLRKSCYIDHTMSRYKKVLHTPICFEETCANSFARTKVLMALADPGGKKSFTRAINKFFASQPPGYKEAASTTDDSWLRAEKISLFDDYYSACMAHVPPHLSNNQIDFGWSLAGQWDKAPPKSISDRKHILIRRHSPLGKSLPSGLCEMKTGMFKKKLGKLGAKFHRHGGNHDIWILDRKKFSIPRHDHADIGRLKHTIEKQIGISKVI
jgi:hypothetical protein